MLKIDTQTGYLGLARHVLSPNFDHRPDGVEPQLIVVHCISLPPGEFGGSWIDDLFLNQLDPNAHEYFTEIFELKVSAHVLINRAGQLIQYVPFHERAWHAGISNFEGRTACNDFSVGIELEGTDDMPFRSLQYWKLAQVICALRSSYRSLENCPVVGHSDIAPGRKTDPGEKFDWPRLKRLLRKLGSKQLTA